MSYIHISTTKLEMELTFLNHAEDKFQRFFRNLDIQVSNTVKESKIETRPSQSNGLWCCALLPLILNIYCLQYAVSPVYKFVAVLSIGLFFYCVLFITFLSLSNMVLQQPVSAGCVASGLISVLMMYTVLGHGLLFCLFYSLASVFLFSLLLCNSLRCFQKTFTIGEAMLLLQAAVLFIIMVAALITSKLGEADGKGDFINTIIYTVLFTVGIIIVALNLLPDSKRNVVTLCYIVGVSGGFGLLILHYLLGLDCISQILHFIFMEGNRAYLILFWAVLVGISVLVLTVRTRLAVKADTVARKSFHLLASLVFMSGVLVDGELIRLAAGIGFGVLLLVEALRKSRIEPISSTLQSAFLVYSDEKDCGAFAVTPLYLYLGLWSGTALAPRGAGPLVTLSGVLAIGVGDAAASWFGSNYGFRKWPGGHRTYEGTMFNILSQVATVYTLQLFDLLDEKYALARTVIAATASGIVEAKTHQVDNLVLPLVTIIAFQATWFLS